MKDNKRLDRLNGLRGVAIILVFPSHVFGGDFAWCLPYGDAYSGIFFVRFGWLGVHLFFLIS